MYFIYHKKCSILKTYEREVCPVQKATAHQDLRFVTDRKDLIKIRTIFHRTKHIPISIVSCMLGACTLSNIYSALGFTLIRHLTVFLCICVVVSYITKILMHQSVIKEEYKNPVTASLYPGICMATMATGAYFYEYFNVFGKAIWTIAIIFHITHIFIFTYLHFIKSRDINTFLGYSNFVVDRHLRTSSRTRCLLLLFQLPNSVTHA